MQVEKLSREKVLTNSLWKFSESICSSAIQLTVTIILARLLSPNDYGVMTLAMVLITFMGLFVNSSISVYLVYIQNIRKQDFLTTLIFNVSLAVVLFLILLLSSGAVASYYSAPILKPVIIAMAVTLPFNAVTSVYNSYAIKMSYYRQLFYRNMVALPVSGIIALVLAYLDFGIWVLVVQQISYSLLFMVIMILSIKIKIDGRWRFDKTMLSPMLRYGGFTFLSTLIAFISDSIGDLLIGKRINSSQLGFYNRGTHFPNAFSNIINNVATSVFFPTFASYNSDLRDLKTKCRKVLRLVNYVSFPIFFGLIACSKPLVLLLLTCKWTPIIPIIQIQCLFYCAIPILQTMSQLFLATGHVRLRALGEFIKMATIVPLLFIFVGYGIIAVAWVRVAVNVVMVIFTMIFAKIYINYKFSEFIADLMKPILVSMLMFVCIYPLIYLNISSLFIVISQILLGISVYLVSAMIFRITEMKQVFEMVLAKFRKQKR